MLATDRSDLKTPQRTQPCVARRLVARTADYLTSDQPQPEPQGDCAECVGTGEGPWDTMCGACRGRGYFGSRA